MDSIYLLLAETILTENLKIFQYISSLGALKYHTLTYKKEVKLNLVKPLFNLNPEEIILRAVLLIEYNKFTQMSLQI